MCNTPPMEPTAVEQRSVADRVAEEHELEVTPSDQAGKGKVGSLENPEVYDNVPGHVIPAGELTTEPAPVPVVATVTAKPAAGEQQATLEKSDVPALLVAATW